MANPALLFLDSDALIQVLMVDGIAILKRLKSGYGIQPCLVPEVEMEVSYSRRFGRRVQGALSTSSGAGTIVVLDPATYHRLLSTNAALQAAAVGTSYADIQARGAAYHRRIDQGEAYTFAAAVTLGQPAVSNDMSAIRAMQQAGLPLPSHVLRAYDLIVFGHQVGVLADRDGERCRQALNSGREFGPVQQKNRSFTDGLRYFVPRLVDRDASPVAVNSANPMVLSIARTDSSH